MENSDTLAGLRRRAQPLLGTLVEVAITVPTEGVLLSATGPAFACIAEIHRAMSFHDADSDVRRLARTPAGACLTLNPHTWQVLSLALELEALSSGAFNVAVAPALVAAGLLPVPEGAPQPQARSLAEGIALLEGDRLRVLAPVWIDLGGIAKGYAVDCAVDCLQKLGIGSGLVNAGGDMRAFGIVEHPIHLRFAHGLRRVAVLQNGALASSGPAGANSPRARSSHTLSPHTLSPHAQGPQTSSPHIDPHRGVAVPAPHSVVVQAPTAAVADALTKVALLAPATADRLCPGLRAQWRAFDTLDP